MSMGEHTRVLTHRTRYIVNKTLDLQKIHKETSVKPEQWFKWFNTNKSVNTFVDNRSYADIVKNVHPSKPNNFDILQSQSTSAKVHKRNASIRPQCAHPKCVQFERTRPRPASAVLQSRVERNTFHRGKQSNKEGTIQLANKFTILQSLSDDANDDSSDGSQFIDLLEGNKNKTGQTLGIEPTNIVDGVVHISKPFKGNKNKTGQTLGAHSPQQLTNKKFHQDKQTPQTFMGTDNGNRAKLGEMLVKSPVQSCRVDVPALPVVKTKVQPRNEPWLECHDLACIQNSENQTMKIYDVMKPPQYKRRQIPQRIIDSKIFSKDYVKCVQQNGSHYGFLPLNDLMVYQGEKVHWAEIPSIIEAHKMVKNSKMPNFMKARIPVPSQLNIASWYKYLGDYWDQQLVDLLHYGFPLDFDRSQSLQSTFNDHASAQQFPDHVDKYIQTEIDYGAMMGPFQRLPFDCHISPFLTREKQNSINRRVIVDLSFPVGQSVNDGVPQDRYLGTYFELNYPSVDTIVNNLKSLGSEALLYKVDISRAFRHIRIDPGDLDLLGLQHKQLFIDCTLPFGFRHGSVIFQRCTDAIRYIMCKKFQFSHLYNYIDDMIYTGLPDEIQESYDTLLALLQELGLEISKSKLVAPTTRAVCLGIEIDTVNKTLKIPHEKLQEIGNICKSFASRNKATKNQLQSLLGSLLYITKCVKPARYFLNRMLQLLRDHNKLSKIQLNDNFHRDLNWFNVFLLQYNGVTFYDHQKPQHTVHLDACLTGFGGQFANSVYTLPIPIGYKDYTIVHLEILNIVVALKLWGSEWTDKVIEVKCDNMAVVEVLRSGRARDPILATCARNVWLLTSLFNINLIVNHIPGVKNQVADMLSRWQTTAVQLQRLSQLVPHYKWVQTHLDHTKLNDNI